MSRRHHAGLPSPSSARSPGRRSLLPLWIALCLGCAGTTDAPPPDDGSAEISDDVVAQPGTSDIENGEEVEVTPPSPTDVDDAGSPSDAPDTPGDGAEEVAGDAPDPPDAASAGDGEADGEATAGAACTAHVATPADFDHTFSWDADGRLLGITWTFPPPLAPGPSEPKGSTATHDAQGRLLSTCCRHWPYPSGDAHHGYDDAGRHLGYEIVTPANPSASPWETLNYSWHEDGTLATATRVVQITEEIVETWSFVYAPDGRLAQRSYNDWIEEVHYDDDGCLSHLLQKFLLPGDGPAELTLTVGHDEAGRLHTFTHPEQGTTTVSWSEGCDLINVGIPAYPGVIDPRFPGLPTQLLPGHVCPP